MRHVEDRLGHRGAGVGPTGTRTTSGDSVSLAATRHPGRRLEAHLGSGCEKCRVKVPHNTGVRRGPGEARAIRHGVFECETAVNHSTRRVGPRGVYGATILHTGDIKPPTNCHRLGHVALATTGGLRDSDERRDPRCHTESEVGPTLHRLTRVPTDSCVFLCLQRGIGYSRSPMPQWHWAGAVRHRSMVRNMRVARQSASLRVADSDIDTPPPKRWRLTAGC